MTNQRSAANQGAEALQKFFSNRFDVGTNRFHNIQISPFLG